jgi:hypothetical protein
MRFNSMNESFYLVQFLTKRCMPFEHVTAPSA